MEWVWGAQMVGANDCSWMSYFELTFTGWNCFCWLWSNFYWWFMVHKRHCGISFGQVRLGSTLCFDGYGLVLALKSSTQLWCLLFITSNWDLWLFYLFFKTFLFVISRICLNWATCVSKQERYWSFGWEFINFSWIWKLFFEEMN